MKRAEKDRAIELRKGGASLNEIVRELGVSKSSVSLWVRDVVLSPTQRRRITSIGRSIDAIEKRRIHRIENTRQKYRAVMDAAKDEIPQLSSHELFLIGVALYWGEGGKTARGMARLSNSDPDVIRTTMRFFREICKVDEKRFRGHVHTFSHLNAQRAEEYWSNVSGIQRSQFYKTYSKPSIAGRGKMDSLPYGTFQVYVCDTALYFKIMGWIERLREFSAANVSLDHIYK